MKIVGVAACTAGIAHTFLAKEKLVKAAQEAGHEVKIETQGTIGTEDELTANEIKEADVVIIAADISISGRDRFKEKKSSASRHILPSNRQSSSSRKLKLN